MIGLRAIKDRFIAPVASPAALIPFRKDWNRTMETLESKLTAARERVARLDSERRAAVVAAVEGDEAAGKNVDKLDRHLADTNREIDRLLIARDNAAQHVATEEAAAAAKGERKRLEGIRKTVESLHLEAAKAETEMADLVARLAKMRAITEDLRVQIGNSEFNDVLREMIMAVPVVVNDRLAASKYPFKAAPFLSSEKHNLAAWLPDSDYVVTLAARKADG